MNAEQLLEHYERIADAPDAIARLRGFVLDLAVRGKLVPQDASDEPVKFKLLRKKLDRKQPTGRTGADLGPITFEEVPVELPSSWRWSRLFQLCVPDAPIVYGILQPGPNTKPEGVPYVRPSEIENGRIILADIRYTTREIANQYSRASLKSGDLILTIVGTIGAVAIVPDELEGGNITQSSCRLRVDPRLIDPAFLLQALRSGCISDQINRMRLGTAVPRLNIAHVRAIATPLPPLAEQRRIIGKVDELMALCDRLEAARAECETTRDRLTTASLAHLNSPDPKTFGDDARFALDALPALTARADQIKQLRQTILNLAVRGKLVPQDANDEPASELLKRITAKKARLVKASKVKKTAVPPPALNSEASFPTPTGWLWTTLGAVSNVVMGQSPPGDTYNKKGEGVPLINGPVEFSKGPFGRTVVNQCTTAPTNFCEEGDLLICVRGSTTGRTNVAGVRACIGRGVAAIQSCFEDAFVRLFIWNARESIIDMGRGIAFPSISRKQLEDLALPLPPLAEQHRIVAKVDELMALCDRLETSLASGADIRSRLLDAIFAGALPPSSLTQRAQPVEAVEAAQ
jgi:type I restriction enzyme S subunit